MTLVFKTDTERLLHIWRFAQINLPKIVRWKKYVNRTQVRVQNTLEHTHSMVTLGAIMIPPLGSDLDEALLLKALHFHDEGEGILGRDTLYIDKTANEDYLEYLGFLKLYEDLPRELFVQLEEAFLLQFAANDHEGFSGRTRAIMAGLRRRKPKEILVFEAIERFDYYLYALEQFIDYDNILLYVQVLRSQYGHLNSLAEALPAFSQFWTPWHRQATEDLLANYEGQFIEQKGET